MFKSFQIFVLVFICSTSYAQRYKTMMDDLTFNYYDVVKEADQYFKTIDINIKGSGYKTFEAWKYENERRYYPTGNRITSNPLAPGIALRDFEKANPIKQNRALNGIWKDLGPYTIDSITAHYAPGLGRLEDVWVSKNNANLIYLCSRSGGFWKTINGGNTWSNLVSDTMLATGVGTLDVSPTNHDSILINVRNASNGYSYGIYRSINGGNSFTPTPFHYTNPALGSGGLGTTFVIHRIKYHPLIPNLILIGTGSGLWRSTNNLTTYNKVVTTDVRDIAFHPTNPAIIYIYNNTTANVNRILISSDTGKTFTAGPIFATNAGARLILSTSNDCSSCIYAISDNGMYKSLDQGNTFTDLGNPPEGVFQAFAVSDIDTSYMVSGYVDAVRSIDGGVSFNKCSWWSLGSAQHGAGSGQNKFFNSSVYVHADLDRAICVNGIFYLCTDGFLAKSADNGATWDYISQGVATRENYSLGTSQSNHYISYCGSQDNGQSLRNKNGWVETYGADGMRAIVTPLNDQWIIASSQYGVRYKSLNQGLTINGITEPQTDGSWVSPLILDPNNQVSFYDIKDSIYRTDDFGSTWIYVGKPNGFTSNISIADIAYNNSQIMAIANNSSIEKSVNGGATFVSIKNNLPSLSIYDIAFDPSDDNTMVVVYGNYNNNGQKIYITTNGGTSWTNITHNLGNIPARCVVIDHTPARNIYIGTEVGIYTKPMNSTNWVRFGINFPNVAVNEMEINFGSNTLKAATWGRGLWEHSLVGRANFPTIVYTSITHAPTLSEPKQGVPEIVKADIHYLGTLSNVFTAWSFDSINFNNFIPMTNTIDSTWEADNALPTGPSGNKVYFKVIAVGSMNDTTISYKYEYKIHPFNYCVSTSNQNSGNHYITNVQLANINNSSNYNNTFYNNIVANLYTDSTYTITVSKNANWPLNDCGAWIDFNRDGVFNNQEEQIMFIVNQSGNLSATFTVPSNAVTNDTTRLRVRFGYFLDATSLSPCLVNSFGESEDYAVKISSAITPVYVKLNIKAFLSGPLSGSTILMTDSLRIKNYLPIVEPYSTAPYYPVFNHTGGGGGEITTNSILSISGNNAIVDWVFIELRSKFDSSIVVATQSALIQRDGDIVAAYDGFSPIEFYVYEDNYFVSLKHRNHIGIMTANSILLNDDVINNLDFTSLNTSLYLRASPNQNGGILTGATRLFAGKRALYAGNCNLDAGANRYILYSSATLSDRTALFNTVGASTTLFGYNLLDCNLDGFARFNGSFNDRVIILNNTGNSNTIVTNEQTPN